MSIEKVVEKDFCVFLVYQLFIQQMQNILSKK